MDRLSARDHFTAAWDRFPPEPAGAPRSLPRRLDHTMGLPKVPPLVRCYHIEALTEFEPNEPAHRRRHLDAREVNSVGTVQARLQIPLRGVESARNVAH